MEGQKPQTNKKKDSRKETNTQTKEKRKNKEIKK